MKAFRRILLLAAIVGAVAWAAGVPEVKVWWPGMVMYRPEKESRERLGYNVDKVITVAFATLLIGANGRYRAQHPSSNGCEAA